MSILISFYCIIVVTTIAVDCYRMSLVIKDVQSMNNDQYLCQTFPIPHVNLESYISVLNIQANSSSLHHMTLFGCREPYELDNINTCHKICADGKDRIMYAWAAAQNGSTKRRIFPRDTGLVVGGKSDINYFVLQVHFTKKSKTKKSIGFVAIASLIPTKYIVGMLTYFAFYGRIPPKQSKAHLDISCKYKGPTVYTLAVRAHTHELGKSVTAYQVSSTSGEISEISKLNPNWPENFYQPSHGNFIRWGDIIMVRCLYDSRKRDNETKIGYGHQQEMCNFYIMIVTKNQDIFDNYFSCGGNEFSDLWKNIPARSLEYSPEQLPRSVKRPQYKLQKDWKVESKMGEVTGVSVLVSKKKGVPDSLVVLHRGDTHWLSGTFRSDHTFTGRTHESTDHTESSGSKRDSGSILEVDIDSGQVIREVAPSVKKELYLVHGVTVTEDSQFIWVTDVARHQALKFRVSSKSGSSSWLAEGPPDMVLGEKFVPGNDEKHFCKPTKVVVDQRGNILVADGYCNSRIVFFYSNGTYADEWRPEEGSMFVVHSLVIVPDPLYPKDIKKNRVWVADRENKRLLAFSYDFRLRARFTGPQGSPVPLPIYAVARNPADKYLYAVCSDGNSRAATFSLDPESLHFRSSWTNQNEDDTMITDDPNIKAPHDLVTANNGTFIFVAELFKKQVLKFKLVGENPSDSSSLSKKARAEFQKLVNKVNPTYMGVSMLGGLVFVVACIVFIKIARQFKNLRRGGRNIRQYDDRRYTSHRRKTNGKKRYTNFLSKDKQKHDGFQPLTQEEPDDDGDDGQNSDGDDCGDRRRMSNGKLDSATTTTTTMIITSGDFSDPETEEFNAASHKARMMKKPTV